MEEKKRLEWVSVVSFYLGIVCYLGLRVVLAAPVVGLVLAIIGLIRFDTTKHRAKWYAVAGLLVNLVSLALGFRDVYAP